MTTANDAAEAVRAHGFRASAEAIRALITHATKSKMSPAQTLLELALLEKREREARNLAARTKAAALGPVKPLDRFDWAHPRSIDRELFEELHDSLGFLESGENVLLRGQAGVGKSTLAKHLGLAALAKGRTVRFTTLATALADLLRRESLPAIERQLRRYTSPDLLIIDELGYVLCDSDAADLLFRIVSKRPRTSRDRDHNQSRLQAMGHCLRRRALPRRSRRSLRSTLQRHRHRCRLLA